MTEKHHSRDGIHLPERSSAVTLIQKDRFAQVEFLTARRGWENRLRRKELQRERLSTV